MKADTFVDKVSMYFGYLEAEYKFKRVLADNSDVRPATDGIVKYSSDSTLILIDSETGQVSIRFIRIQDDERYYLDPVSIHEYLSTNEEEKRILLSTDVKDQKNAQTIFEKTFLLSTSLWRQDREDAYVALERQLKNYSDWLRANANYCLLGDFSYWPIFYEYKINRLKADELRRGGKSTVLAVIRDENEVIKTVARPIFMKEMEHLAKLKREILGD